MSPIVFDTRQQKIFNKINKIILCTQNSKKFSAVIKQNSVGGIYLYGPIGHGKTLIMSQCFENITQNKQFFYYQEFIENFYKEIYLLENNSREDVLDKIAKDYALKTRFLFIDSFEMKSIDDAIFIGPLLTKLIKNKVFIFITSNIAIENLYELYENDLQRDYFLPCLNFIKENFLAINLISTHDYRFTKFPQNADRVFYPNDKTNNEKINNIIYELTKNELIPSMLTIFGKNIGFIATYKNVLVTDFGEMFLRELTCIDYAEICKNFSTIVVKDIKSFTNNSDIAIRFINFIDNAYSSKITLYLTLGVRLEQAYLSQVKKNEFKRALSKIYEMNSNLYKHNL